MKFQERIAAFVQDHFPGAQACLMLICAIATIMLLSDTGTAGRIFESF